MKYHLRTIQSNWTAFVAPLSSSSAWRKFGRFLSGGGIAVVLSLFASGTSLSLTSVNQPGATGRYTLPAPPSPNKTLIVGSEQDYPPFATGMTDETAGGFTVSLWKAVAEEAGLKYAIRVRPFRQILQEFKEGKIDVLINLAISDERRQFADLTIPHVIVNGALFVRQGNSAIRSEDDFAGKSIIVLNADLGHDYAVSRGWGKQLVLVDTSAEGFRLLGSGKHDAMLLSKLTGMQTLQALGLTNIEVLKAKAGFSQKFAFAVHKGQSDLLATLNEGLVLTKSDGTYNALYEKWFGIYETKEVGLRDQLKYIVPMVLVFVIIGAYFFYLRQKERRASETKLRTLYTAIEQTPASIVITDLDACIQYVNPEFTEVSGYAADEAIGQNPRILKSGQTANDIYQQLWDTIRNGQPWRGELLNKRKNGELYWEEVHMAPVLNQTGVASHYVAVKIDITERKQFELALASSQEQFRQAFAQSPIGMLLCQLDGRVFKANAAFCRMSGYADNEIIGHRLGDLAPPTSTVDEEIALFAKISEGEIDGFSFQQEQVRKDGHVYVVQSSVSLVRSSTNAPLYCLVHVDDLTERQRRQLEALAKHSLNVQEEERTRLSRELHDDVGQSLTALKLMLRRVQQNCSYGQATECLRQANEATEHLMSDVRAIAYRLRPSQLDDLGLMSSLRWHLDKVARPAQLDAVLRGNLGNQRLPEALELCCFRVAQEALTNVLKHACASTLEVDLNREDTRVLLTLRDNGIGFDVTRHYLMPDNSSSLGLIGMRERVAALGGRLEVKSSPGRGTEIRATFPVPRPKPCQPG